MRRLIHKLSPEQQAAIPLAAQKRLGVFYDTGFNVYSGRQFCSRYVREVLAEATGHLIGDIQSFTSLFARNPKAHMVFWRLWYFGRIPWQRQTVTPASLLVSPQLKTLFNGYISKHVMSAGNNGGTTSRGESLC